MFAKILDVIEIEKETFVALDNGKIVSAYELSLIDAETASISTSEAMMTQFLETLSPKVLCRVWLLSKPEFSESFDHSRSKAIGELGFVDSKLLVFLELESSRANELSFLLKSLAKPSDALQSRAQDLKHSYDISVLRGVLRVRNLSREEIESHLVTCSAEGAYKTSVGLDLGHAIAGTVRLFKQGTNPISALTLGALKDSLPLPFKISTTLKKISPEISEGILRRKTNQAGEGSDKIAAQKFLDTQEALTEVALNGASLFNMELLVELERSDEKELRTDLNLVAQKLRSLGDWTIETFGAFPSFMSVQVGSDQHVPLLEVNNIVPSFLPMWTAGSSRSIKETPEKRSLALARRDQSVSYVDVFNPAYDNYSVCIFGKSGRGKSVLTNLLTRALHFDDSIQIIKVDVGGSHSKETKLLGGKEFVLNLNQPSGINPFGALSEGEHSEDICAIISSFINVLLLEEGEHTLTKSMRAEVEKAVARYSALRPQKPSVSDFFDSSPDLPRRELLERWTSSGAYRNAFSVQGDIEDRDASSRLRYYNFAQIFQANDPDFGQGGLAAVMAQFNLELMRSKGKKLVFIADETPFFIERCFSFFKFSTANVRKFGGSFITIAQKSSDVIVGGDPGILENSSSKFLFSVDGEKDAFARRMKLEPSVVDQIEDLKSEKGRFTEVLYTDTFGSRVFKIELSSEEYWRVTSSQSDNDKLNKLLSAVPGLTLQEAVACLAR